jgi:phosphatidylglycerophosphatase A
MPGWCHDSGVTTSRTVAERLLILVGSLGPLGHAPASGTVTVAVIGIPLYWLMQALDPAAYLWASGIFVCASVAIHHVGDQILGDKDSGLLVWDELAGFLVAVAFVPFTWQLATAAFLLERVLDIIKFPPADRIEREWPGGWGVVGDDLVAGLYTCAILHLLIRFAPGLVGVAA